MGGPTPTPEGESGPGGGTSILVRPPSLHTLEHHLGTIVAILSTCIGKSFFEVILVWGSEETCAAPYNGRFLYGALSRT